MREYSTLHISKNDQRQLRLISALLNQKESEVVSEFIEDVFRRIRVNLQYCLTTGEFLALDYDIRLNKKPDLVKNQYPASMNEDADDPAIYQLNERLAFEQFETLNAQKEINRKKFRKVLDSNFPKGD